MRDKKRIKRITEKIAKIWIMYPDQRLFQLLFNYGFLQRAEIGRVYDPFGLEDDNVEKHLDKILSGEVTM